VEGHGQASSLHSAWTDAQPAVPLSARPKGTEGHLQLRGSEEGKSKGKADREVGRQGSRTGIESAQAAACSPAGQSRAGRTRPHVQSWTGIEPARGWSGVIPKLDRHRTRPKLPKVGQASNPPGVGAASSRSVSTGRTRGTNSDRHRILGQASNPRTGIESSDRHRILGQASNPGIESWHRVLALSPGGDRIGVTPRLFTGMCGLASS